MTSQDEERQLGTALTVRVSPEQKAALSKHREASGAPYSFIIRGLLERWMDENRKPVKKS